MTLPRAVHRYMRAHGVAWCLRLAMTSVFAACGGGGGDGPSSPTPPAPAPVASVTLSQTSALIDVASTVQLSAVARNSAGAALTGRTITWTSAAPAVATVSGDGVVTGVLAGTAQITASSEGQSASAAITVQARLGSPATLAIQAGNNQQAASGAPVSTAPAVLVRDRTGAPVAGATVQFAVTSGGGSVVGASPVTDAAGIARVTTWTLGTSGVQKLSAQVGALPPLTFDATVTPATVPTEGIVAVSGGTVIISTTGHPWEGTTLTVPPNTFPVASSWRLRTGAATDAPTLPAGVSLQGLPLRIETAQLRGDRMMTLRVPIEAKAGKQVLLALYDPIRGAIEVMPTVARTATSVTVLTGHLHPTLLLGPNPPASSANPFAGFRAVQQADGISTLLKLETLLAPLLEVGAVSSTQDLWPAPDLATEGFKSGHGNAIPTMNTMLRSLSTSLNGVLKAIGPVGFLADTASFGTLEIITKKLSTAMEAPLQALRDVVQDIPKAELDQIVTSHISTNLAVTGRPAPVGLFESRNLVAARAAYATALASTATGVQVNVASDRSNKTLAVTAQGIPAIAVKAAAQAANFDANVALPMSSFTVPYEIILPDLQRMVRGLTGTGIVRQSVNEAIASLAGLPAINVEHQATPDGPWTPVKDTLVFRKAFGKLRAVLNGASQLLMVADASTYTETLRSAVPIDISQLPNFAATPERAVRAAIGSVLKGIGQALEQLLPLNLAYVKEPFVITPKTVKISSANRKADFSASVGRPPSEGFRIKWEWGDDTPPTENLGLTSATHTYTDIRNHTVIATLIRNDVARTVLAADTVQVEVDGLPIWRITTIFDSDTLYDQDTPTSGVFIDLLPRPGSGLILTEQVGNGTELRLRTKRAGVWADTDCCPIPAYNPALERLLRLGSNPATNNSFGPYFSAWAQNSWSQTSTALDAGTFFGRSGDGTFTYNIKDQGTQVGPEVGVQIEATRAGNLLTGRIILTGWYTDSESGEVDSPPELYRFPFTAVRIR